MESPSHWKWNHPCPPHQTGQPAWSLRQTLSTSFLISTSLLSLKAKMMLWSMHETKGLKFWSIVAGSVYLLVTLTHDEDVRFSNMYICMSIQKVNTVIPAHVVAEAISTLHGLDLRWSGPITLTEVQYVEQYVLAKYPEYGNGLLDDTTRNLDCINDIDDSSNSKKKSPMTVRESLPSDTIIERIQLEPSKLVDASVKKAGNFISIPEIQARNRALQICGLTEEEYLVVFTPSAREAMAMVGEAYPFFRGNYYMTVLGNDDDVIREFVGVRDSKVVVVPTAWLDLRIKGSQLSQYFRRKCKSNPKGLFAYSASTNGVRSSMHWISEAHRNSWHVLLDAAGQANDCLPLALHRPDFVTCTVDVIHAHPSMLNCLLVRKKSFETAT